MNNNVKTDNKSKRSKQNLSCNWTGSADFGRLVPIHWEELLAGDHVLRCSPRIEVQMLPFASPTFGKIDLYCHYFVVPIRLLQKNFYSIWSQTGVYKSSYLSHLCPKDFSSQYKDSVYTDANRRGFYKHWTSLGLPPFFTTEDYPDNETPISLYPFFAYNQIWWDFYRDPEVLRDESKSQYLTDSDYFSGQTIPQDFGIKYLYPHIRTIKNNWISNLFSSDGNFLTNMVFQEGELPSFQNISGDRPYYEEGNGEYLDFAVNRDGNDSVEPRDNTSRMYRLIESLTRLSERLSLSGKREIEQLFARYHVKPNWSKMNMCRYVGGGKAEVIVDNIISTSDTSGTDGMPLGAQGGKGYCALSNLNIEVSVDEPSILMGIVSMMPHIHFVQGLSRKWQRRSLQDMFQESLQFVGQVAIAKREVGYKYEDGVQYDSNEDGDTFAFSDPYYEYKMGLDILAGDFMRYHDSIPSDRDVKYMQSLEQYIDYPQNRNFSQANLEVDGEKYNKIFEYLGGSVFDDVDDHFHLCVDKEVVIERPMEGYPVPTLETTQDPHVSKTALSGDKML